jgi:G patch domain and KOW motifs-containing protein
MLSGNGNSGKVAFSLAKKKPKKSEPAPVIEFGEEIDRKQEELPEQERSTPLVIPLSDTSKQSLLERKRADKAVSDDAAAHALMQSAARHFDGSNGNGGVTTNFDATGDLIISSGTNQLNTAKQAHSHSQSNDPMTDSQQFQTDLQNLPPELDISSETYKTVPIQEFGAALLRGMGWTGNDEATATQDPLRRPHRLGLGATPKLPPTHSKTKMRTVTQVQRDEQLAQQQKELEAQQQQRILLDKQLTLQIGSLVYAPKKRASILQLLGVPGLNRVLVQMEGDNVATSVKKGDMSLIPRSELETRPFVGRELNPEQKMAFHGEAESSRRNQQDIKEDDRKDGHKASRHEIHRDGGDQRRRKGDDDQRGDQKRSRGDDRRLQREVNDHKKIPRDDAMHWIIPNIRIRVVTRKLGSVHYTQKGIVMDVTHGGATVHMSSGQVLDNVPERYLETALPKTGGNVIVLVGRHKFAKGKLLERDSNRGRGAVQVFEDMSVLTLKLDDLAEWCGPLDDDLQADL